MVQLIRTLQNNIQADDLKINNEFEKIAWNLSSILVENDVLKTVCTKHYSNQNEISKENNGMKEVIFETNCTEANCTEGTNEQGWWG